MNNKHTFWQAFLVASLIFWIGLLIGVFFENNRVDVLNDFYSNFESDISDFDLLANVIFDSNSSCEQVSKQAVFFADKIYEGALKLEKYEDSNKITRSLFLLHRKYDLLRTRLWIEVIKYNQKCSKKINTVVYLYKYKDPSLTTRGVQGVMSSYLIDLKEKYNDRLILIPISADTNILALDFLRNSYNVSEYPSILVNEKIHISNLDNLKEIENALK